jgi:hypothetical protein
LARVTADRRPVVAALNQGLVQVLSQLEADLRQRLPETAKSGSQSSRQVPVETQNLASLLDMDLLPR